MHVCRSYNAMLPACSPIAPPRPDTLPRTYLLLYKPNGVSANGSQKVYHCLRFSSVGAPTGANGRQRIANNTFYFPRVSSVGAPTGANGRQRIDKKHVLLQLIFVRWRATGANGRQRIACTMGNSGKTRKLDQGNKNASTFVSVPLPKQNQIFVKHIEKYEKSKSKRNSSQSNIEWLRFSL